MDSEKKKLPKLRRGLEVVRSEIGKLHYIVKDPVTQRFFRLGEHEWFVAACLDELSDVSDIARRFEERFGQQISEEAIERFINRLDSLCLLERGLDRQGIARRQKTALRQPTPIEKLLQLKVRMLDPTRVIECVYPMIRLFFTREFLVLASLAILVAVAVTISNWDEFIIQAKALFKVASLPTFLLVVFLVSVLHEFAHAFTCRHFEGKVSQMGVMLIYFLPAFYCDVSDAWLLADKRKRIWVSFSGTFFQLFLWAIATIAWRFVAMDTWLSQALCIAMATSGISSLFNLNPLIKLDGYYILSDWLEIPNLRRKAFLYIARILHTGSSLGETAPEFSAREKRVCLLYGLTSGVYSLGLLTIVLAKIGRFVVTSFHDAGLVVLVLVIAVAADVSGRFFAKTYSSLRLVLMGKAKRRKIAWWVGICLVVSILFLARLDLRVRADFEVIAGERVSIAPELEGKLVDVCVDIGDTVNAGDLIARIDDTRIRSELERNAAEIARAEAEVDLLKSGATPEEVDKARKAVEMYEAELGLLEKDRTRIAHLVSKNLLREKELERSEGEVVIKRKQLEQAQKNLEILLAGNRPEKIRAAEAEKERLLAERRYLLEQMERTRLKSPIRGIVTGERLTEKIGSWVGEGDEVCQVVGSGAGLVEMFVKEADISEVRVGQRFKAKVRALPRETLWGRVVSISPAGAKKDGKRVFIVHGDLKNPHPFLKPGMTGCAKIYCGKRTVIGLITRRLIGFIRVEFWI